MPSLEVYTQIWDHSLGCDLIGSSYDCCVTNYPELSGLKQFYFAPYFVVQELEKSLAGEFAYEVSHAVVIRCQLG